METNLERSITLRQLRIFTSVIEHGSFTRAAEILSLTQPAVTHQMQALARAVGRPILDPGSRAPVLTAVGQALHERAGRILAMVGDAQEAIEDVAGLRTGRVRVAGDTTVGIYVLPDAMAAFHREHLGVALSLDVVNRAQVRELILEGIADVGVVGTLWEDDALAAEPFLDNSLMCFCAPGHPLADREPLQPIDLLDGPLLLREPGSGTRDSAERILRAAGAEPIAAMEMASNGALKRAVAGGLGVTVLSTYAVRLELQLGLLRPLQVQGFPVERQWHVTWRASACSAPRPPRSRRSCTARPGGRRC
jgi:DNA-binding transcriptional LysR family regulator